jgi:hypothetical protein
MAFRCCVYARRSRFCAESSFEEYKLDNGLHVILHNDPSVYCNHISDAVPKTKILKELVLSNFLNIYYLKELKILNGEWFKIVTGNGGEQCQYTTDDRTYYYEVFLQII